MDFQLVGGESFWMSVNPENREIQPAWNLLIETFRLHEIGVIPHLPPTLENIHKIHRIIVKPLYESNKILIKTEGTSLDDKMKLDYCKKCLMIALCDIFKKTNPGSQNIYSEMKSGKYLSFHKVTLNS